MFQIKVRSCFPGMSLIQLEQFLGGGLRLLSADRFMQDRLKNMLIERGLKSQRGELTMG